MNIGIGIRIGGKGAGIFVFEPTEKPTNLAVTLVSDTIIAATVTNNAPMINGYSWEYSTDNATWTIHGTSSVALYDYTALIANTIYYFRCRVYKGGSFSEYSNIANITPSVLKVNSANTSVLLADASNELYFNNGAGSDLPFSVLAIAKSNAFNITNTLLSRGNASGCSYNIRLNAATGETDIVIYGSDLTNNNLLYAKSGVAMSAGVKIRVAYTYDGSKVANGIKMYLNGIEPSAYIARAKYGTYNNMNNRAGVYVGRMVKDNEQGNLDLDTLLIVNKVLSQAEITEFQNIPYDYNLSGLSFWANVLSCHQFNSNLLDDKGNHNGSAVAPAYANDPIILRLPSLVKMTKQEQFENFKLGWFVCYGMETYNGDEFNGRTVACSAPEVFDAPATVDVAAWASLAASYNRVDYAILSVSHIYGFSLFDHQTAIYGGSRLAIGVDEFIPQYLKYDVGETDSDKNIASKFATEFNAVGIKPIFYYCISWSRNWLHRNWANLTYHNSQYQFLHYHAYLKARLLELVNASDPFGIWLDAPIYYPYHYQRDLYAALKRAKPDLLIFFNCYGAVDKSDNQHGPFDVMSIEELVFPALPTNAIFNPEQTIKGVTYPCLTELVAATRINHTWFYSSTPAALRTLGNLQPVYNYAKAAGVPLALSINPKLDGTIDTDQADLIGDIVL